ncbi:MAG: asparagine--tRNA ligase [Deltaproteobacteria bacterium]|nr:asparagine--tRNA ligase [Deltaproteobacteria bacterium]
MQKISIRQVNQDKISVGSYIVEGWVRTHRQSKNVSFIDLSDGTAVKGLQLVINPTLEGYQELAPRITTGAAIRVEGQLAASPAKGQKFEFQVTKLELVGEADAESYPLQKKGHTLEFLREILHLRPRSNTFGAVFRVRSEASMAINKFFYDRGFYYVHTPIITSSDCEGAGAMFRVTTLDLANVPKTAGKVDFSQDFFKAEASLTVSGQLEGEIFATALNKIYTFGPTFRAENSNTTRHLSEFWMIEPEMAFYNLQDNMQLAQDFIKYLIKWVLDTCQEEMQFFLEREWVAKDHVQNLEHVVNSQFTAMDYTEAIKVLEKSGKKFEFPVHWGMDLQSEHERYLTDEYVKGPMFVVNYPKDIKAFYMKVNDDGKTVRAMDTLVPRLGEIIGGSQREERHDVLLERIREMKLPEENYWWYLQLRKFGTVPHAGFGLGFERFLMYVTGMQNIRDVIPFPRYPGYSKF